MALLLGISEYGTDESDADSPPPPVSNEEYEEQTTKEDNLLSKSEVGGNAIKIVAHHTVGIKRLRSRDDSLLVGPVHGVGTICCQNLRYQHEITEAPHLTELNPLTLQSIKQYLEAQRVHGFSLMKSIRANKDFGNPSLLTKIVEHFKIEQRGSNYPKSIHDPCSKHFQPESLESCVRRRRKVVHTAPNLPATDSSNSTSSVSQPRISTSSTSTTSTTSVDAITCSAVAALLAAKSRALRHKQCNEGGATATTDSITSAYVGGGTMSVSHKNNSVKVVEPAGTRRRRSKWG